MTKNTVRVYQQTDVIHFRLA